MEPEDREIPLPPEAHAEEGPTPGSPWFDVVLYQRLNGARLATVERGVPARGALHALRRADQEHGGQAGVIAMLVPSDDVLNVVARELERARRLHAPLNSAHEAYAVILEELDEFKTEVWRRRSERNPAAMRTELIQLVAMALRTIEDLEL